MKHTRLKQVWAPSRRDVLVGGTALVLGGAGSQARHLLVGGAGGSAGDVAARAFAAFLQRHLPAGDLHVQNLPGRAGLNAYQALAGAAPDGMTLGWTATPGLPARSIDGSCPQLLTELTLIGAVQREPVALVAPPGGADTIAAFRQAAAAGDPIGTPPSGSPSHLAALRLADLTGLKLNLVVFPSAAAVRQAVLDGNVGAATMALGEAIAALREGRMNGLGIAAERPAAAFPQMPPLQGNDLPLTAYIIRGIAAPSAVPASCIDAITQGLQAVAVDPEYQAHADSNGFEAIWLEGPAWTRQTMTERAALTQLWQRTPWTAEETG